MSDQHGVMQAARALLAHRECPIHSPEGQALATAVRRTERDRVPISAPGSTLEDLHNDLKQLCHVLAMFRVAVSRPGDSREHSDAVSWLRARIAETENTIDALEGAGPPTDGK